MLAETSWPEAVGFIGLALAVAIGVGIHEHGWPNWFNKRRPN